MYVSSPATIRLVTNHSSSSRGSRYVNVMCAFPSPALKRRHNSRPPVNPPTRRFGSARVGLDRLSRHILPSGWGVGRVKLGSPCRLVVGSFQFKLMKSMIGENRQLVTDEPVDAPITPNFPFVSSRKTVGDYVKK